MRSNISRRMALLSCAATMVALPSYGHAQEEAGATASDRDIIVTATRRNEALKDVAMSVDVASGDKLEQLNIFDAKDISQLAPGLQMTNTTGRNNTTTLRGISFDPDSGTTPAVQVYFNELPADAQTVYTAMYDIQQVEVLRGPQGLLRGLSAPAGAITFATRKPSFTDIEGYTQATVTSREGYNVQGAVSLPLSDQVALRLAAVVDGNRLNHVKNIHNGDRSRSRTQSFRATLGYQPDNAFSSFITYQYLTADNLQNLQVVGAGNTPAYLLGTFIGQPVPLTPDSSERSGPALKASDYSAVSEGRFRIQNETHLINLQTSYDFGGATLSFVGGYQYSMLDTVRDLDPANAVPNYISYSEVEIPYKVTSAELRLASNNDEGFGWGLGSFYTQQKGTTAVRESADVFFFPTSVNGTRDILGEGPYLPISTQVFVPVDTSTLSFNANARYKNGGVKIEGGIRYSIIKANQSADIYISSPGSIFAGEDPFEAQVDGVPAELVRNREKAWTGGINATYEITPEINIYAAYGRAFRAGSTGVAIPVGISADLIQTKPEKTDSYEIGFKGSAFDRRVNFSVTGFYQEIDGFLGRFDDIYYNCPEVDGACYPSPPAPPINGPGDETPINGSFHFNYNADAIIKGIEAQFDSRITDNWDLGISASYIKARLDKARVPCSTYTSDGNPVIIGEGNVSYCNRNGRLADTPDFNMTVNSEVRAPIGDNIAYLRGIFTYRPGFYSEQSDYHFRHNEMLNFFLGLRSDKGWDVNIFARNLLAQSRVTQVALGIENMPTKSELSYQSGYRLVNVMPPREFGLTAAYKF